MNDKYTLAEETKTVSGHTPHRIKALKDFAHARVGQLGGWIETEKNLSGSGDAVLAGVLRVVGTRWMNQRHEREKPQSFSNLVRQCRRADFPVKQRGYVLQSLLAPLTPIRRPSAKYKVPEQR